MAKAEAAHGPATVLINNAAFDERHDIADVTLDYWENNQAINLRPHFFTAQAVFEGMKRAGHGSIINFTSTSFMINHPDMPSYTAAKAGIIGLTKGLAGRLGRHGIRVNAVAPGWVMTERQRTLWVTPEALATHVARQCINEEMAPDDMVGPCLFLASDAVAHVDRADHDRRRGLSVSAGAVAIADWGTTRLRVWLLDENGAVLAERRSDEGLLSAQPDRFSEILERHLAAMDAGDDAAGADLRHGRFPAGLDRSALRHRPGGARRHLRRRGTGSRPEPRHPHRAGPCPAQRRRAGCDARRGNPARRSGPLRRDDTSSACPAPIRNGSRWWMAPSCASRPT